MKKIFIAVASVLLVTLLLAAIPVLGAWVGTLRGEANIAEALEGKSLSLEAQTIFPGQEVTWQAEVVNKSPVEYGVIYDPWAWLAWPRERGMELATSNPSPGAKLTIGPSVKNYELATVTVQRLGELTMMLDPDADGPAEPAKYSLGQVVNIAPGGKHRVSLTLKVFHTTNSGTANGYINFYRETPNESG